LPIRYQIILIHTLDWSGRTLSPSTLPLIAIRDQKEHQRRRLTWARGFSTSAVKGYESIVLKRVDQLVETLLSKNGPLDLAALIAFFAQVPSF
jgi:cytochrome P450